MLIIFAGLPGVGKTTLARALASRIDAVYLRIDSIEQAIVNSSLDTGTAVEAGYLVGYAVAEDNLKLGRTVVADSVNSIELTRTAWLNVARNTQQKSVEVEVICSDPAIHRRRVETRTQDIDGLVGPTWQAVSEREYHGWNRDRIIIDTSNKPPSQSLEDLMGCFSSE